MSFATVTELPAAVAQGLAAGTLAPYLGPGMLALCAGATPPPDPLALATVLAAKSSVPGKIRHRATAVAQFIENFKHRKTLVAYLTEAYATPAAPSPLHRWLAGLPAPLIVDTWYDDTLRSALAAARGTTGWSEVQGLSQSDERRAAPSRPTTPAGGGAKGPGGRHVTEHFGTWTGWYAADGSASPDELAAPTVLYKPWGGHAPAANFLASDTDFVEVLTEIDIQTPIPALVQARRATLGFVFLGCRFNDQLPRAFARQIIKRSRGPHYAVLADAPTRMEARFLEEQGITRIALPLAEVAAQLLAGAPLAQAA